MKKTPASEPFQVPLAVTLTSFLVPALHLGALAPSLCSWTLGCSLGVSHGDGDILRDLFLSPPCLGFCRHTWVPSDKASEDGTAGSPDSLECPELTGSSSCRWASSRQLQLYHPQTRDLTLRLGVLEGDSPGHMQERGGDEAVEPLTLGSVSSPLHLQASASLASDIAAALSPEVSASMCQLLVFSQVGSGEQSGRAVAGRLFGVQPGLSPGSSPDRFCDPIEPSTYLSVEWAGSGTHLLGDWTRPRLAAWSRRAATRQCRPDPASVVTRVCAQT